MKKKLSLVAAIFVVAGYIYSILAGGGLDLDRLKKEDGLPPQILAVQKEGLAPNKYINALVTKVTDGDTIQVKYKGENYKVRLLYIDTPESVKTGVAVQPYSKEASGLTRKLTLDKTVKLVFEKGLKDRYGRLLAHVILEDGTYLNALLVRNGYARVEVVSPNNSLAEYFYRLQDKAIEEGLGFWSLPENKRPFVKDEEGNYVPVYSTNKKAS